MIFVTVGTHEQPFNRLIEEVDKLKRDGKIDDDVIIQKGYSTYNPKFCTTYDFLAYDDMQQFIKEARIILTHGGPASFIIPLSLGKKPIVVPRQKKYNEHVNDHQLEFAQNLVKRDVPLIVIDDINGLFDAISNYSQEITQYSSNNDKFCNEINNIIKHLF